MERTDQTLVDAHERTVVLELTTVVGRSEDSHQLTLPLELVPLLHHLVRTADQVQVEPTQRTLYHVPPECVADTPLVLPPAADGRVRIGPQDVAQHALVRDFDRSFDGGQVREFLEIGGEASVHAEDLFIDESHHGHDIEDIHEVLPDLKVVPAFACVQ